MTRKFSSCSTIFIDDSTVSQPNLKNTIRAVALAVYFHIRNRNRGINGSVYPPDEHDDRLVEIFDEKLHPLSVSHLSPTYLLTWIMRCHVRCYVTVLSVCLSVVTLWHRTHDGLQCDFHFDLFFSFSFTVYFSLSFCFRFYHFQFQFFFSFSHREQE